VFRIIPVSPLEKIFAADKDCSPKEYNSFSMLKGERSSFQVAVWQGRDDESVRGTTYYDATVRIDSGIADLCSAFVVEESPCDLPAYPDHDGDVISDKPGLYPDILRPVTPDETRFSVLPERWRVFWIELDVPADAKAGAYEVRFSLMNGEETLCATSVKVKIIDAVLPEQTLRYINWFHCDCIAEYYHVPMFSERHWELLGKYMAAAARHGMNTLLTPIFTPPLDTEIGGERPTVQLVDVTVDGGKYSFGFEKFERYIRLALESGMKYFEISHMFTQWGAKHAPKIMATVDGEYRRLFGWETDAAGEEYTAFLKAFAAELVPELERLGIRDRCYFHVSDEPQLEHIESYAKAAAIVHELFKGFKFIDAGSCVEYYDRGLVKIPIPKTERIGPFLERDIAERWCYYCCGAEQGLSCRSIAVPSRRNRIIGLQLYKYGMSGFLHWGYNFWFSRLSRELIDPLRTIGAGVWPSGNPFIVYPGADGEPLVSLRLKVFYDALEDMRACQLLETLIGREKVIALIDEGLDEPLRFNNGPRCDRWLLEKREKINELIEQNI